MSLALMGLRHPGIEIRPAACVAKTHSGFFHSLAAPT
jgi:5-enolpyruvylshikimate-3-phosphate synthase